MRGQVSAPSSLPRVRDEGQLPAPHPSPSAAAGPAGVVVDGAPGPAETTLVAVADRTRPIRYIFRYDQSSTL